MAKRVFLIVLDSCGIGEAPDAEAFGDKGANTLGSISKSKEFNIENLKNLGFTEIDGLSYLGKGELKAEELDIKYVVGNVLSSDVFYGDTPEQSANWQKMGVLAVEMEAAALFMNAARAGKCAGAMFTISDHILTGESLPAIDRQNSFTDMMKLALETAVELENK